MYPKVGETAKYTFNDTFAPLNGIYKVAAIAPLDEWLANKIDISKETYAKVDRTQQDYQDEVNTFKNEDIYKLVNVETKDTIYVPMSFTSEIPDPNVFAYQKIAIALSIGEFDDPAQIEWVKSELSQMIEAVTGVITTPKIFETSTRWMTEAEYAAIEAAREANKRAASTHYTDKNALLQQVNRLQTQVAYYEAHFKAEV